jgi:transposase-like protein
MFHLDQDAIEVFQGQIELDESYFGGARKGKRGRGAAGKVIVLVYSSAMVKSIRSLYLILNRAP